MPTEVIIADSNSSLEQSELIHIDGQKILVRIEPYRNLMPGSNKQGVVHVPIILQDAENPGKPLKRNFKATWLNANVEGYRVHRGKFFTKMISMGKERPFQNEVLINTNREGNLTVELKLKDDQGKRYLIRAERLNILKVY